MPDLSANEDVRQMGIYAGVAAGAGVIGMGYASYLHGAEPIKKRKKRSKAEKPVGDQRVQNVEHAERMAHSIDKALTLHQYKQEGYDKYDASKININLGDTVEYGTENHGPVRPGQRAAEKAKKKASRVITKVL